MKKKAPRGAIIDSQTVKMAGQRGECGYDAGKKVLGRKRHVLVDTLGRLLAVVVHPANIQDRDGAKLLLSKALKYGRLRCIFAARGYAGTLLQRVKQLFGKQGTRVEIVSKAARGFDVLPK